MPPGHDQQLRRQPAIGNLHLRARMFGFVAASSVIGAESGLIVVLSDRP